MLSSADRHNDGPNIKDKVKRINDNPTHVGVCLSSQLLIMAINVSVRNVSLQASIKKRPFASHKLSMILVRNYKLKPFTDVPLSQMMYGKLAAFLCNKS